MLEERGGRQIKRDSSGTHRGHVACALDREGLTSARSDEPTSAKSTRVARSRSGEVHEVAISKGDSCPSRNDVLTEKEELRGTIKNRHRTKTKGVGVLLAEPRPLKMPSSDRP